MLLNNLLLDVKTATAFRCQDKVKRMKQALPIHVSLLFFFSAGDQMLLLLILFTVSVI